MHKTLDEIKKGLGEAIAEASWAVDDGDMHVLRDALDNARANMADALACIKQLEERAHQLDLLNLGLLVEKAQLEAERGAAYRRRNDA